MNTTKVPQPSTIEGVTGPENIAELWGKHYSDLFNSVKSEYFNIGEVCHENVTVTVKQIDTAIKK